MDRFLGEDNNEYGNRQERIRKKKKRERKKIIQVNQGLN